MTLKLFLNKIKNRIRLKIKYSKPVRWLSDFYEGPVNFNKKNIVRPALKGWSVVVITNGKSLESVKKLVASAGTELRGSPAEIIIVGPKSFRLDYNADIEVKYLDFRELDWAPGWITLKKNLGVMACKYDKVALCHDYIVFSPGWKQGYDRFGEDFEVCMNKITNYDGSRFRDWAVCDYPGIGFGSLPYDVSCPEHQYISGTYFVVKRDFFIKYPLNIKLRWGEGEDGEWSKIVREVAAFKFNPFSTVTFSKQKEALPPEWIINSEKLKSVL